MAGGFATVSGLGSATYLLTRSTIEQQLIGEGLKLIKDVNDYKFILFTHKNNQELKTAISKDNLDLNQEAEVKKWCENNLKKWTTDSLLKNAREWCVIPKVKTLKDKLSSKLKTGKDWQEHFKSLASVSGTSNNKFLTTLNASFSGANLNQTSPNGGAKLAEWCTSALNQKIYEVDSTNKTEENILAWCLNGS